MNATVSNRALPTTVELQDVIPLNTPFVLLVDPASTCNLKCVFCPTGHGDIIKKTGRFQGPMTLDIFKKIIDDVAHFEFDIRVLRLYKEGEPLVNKHLEEMIDYARKSNRILRIDTTTNGILLNKVRNRKLISAGIDRINISINGICSEHYTNYTKTKVDFKKLIENVEDLYSHKENCEIFIKAIKENLTEEERETFFTIFGDISDKIFLESISPAWPEFDIDATFTSGHYGQPIEHRDVCPYIFYIMVINSDGTVCPCVGDWKHKIILGDAKTERLVDIWNGRESNHLRLLHLSKNRSSISPCKSCLVPSHGTVGNNIDAYADVLFQKLSEAERKIESA